MPPSPFQSRVLKVIAANRSPDSHIAGGVALNYDGARLSFDIDNFHDRPGQVALAAEADARVLSDAGFEIEWLKRFPTLITARISDGTGQTSLDWVQDSAVRFFPVQPHPDLGFALHPFDLATNKALAAANRMEPRDALDIVAIHETLCPLGAVAWAAVGKDEGFSPELLLNFIIRFGRHQQDALEKVESREPISAADLSLRLKAAVWDARAFVETMPPETVGHAFLLNGEVVQPDPNRLSDYTAVAPVPGGVWPISVD